MNDKKVKYYKSIDELNHENTNQNTQNKNITILTMNIRSIRNKLEDIEEIIDTIQNQVHILVITETWLTKSEEDFFNILGYKSTFISRENRKGGGIGIFIQNHIQYNIKKTWTDNKSAILSIKIRMDTMSQQFQLMAIYRADDTEIKEIYKNLEDHLDENNKIIIVGDLNINILENNAITKEYKNWLSMHNLHIVNNKITTRKGTLARNEKDSLIDHVITNFQNLDTVVSIIENQLSDHQIIITQLAYNYNKEDRTSVTRSWKKTEFNKLAEELQSKPFSTNEDELNKKYESFILYLQEAIAKFTTTKTITLKRQMPNTNWVTKDLRNIIKMRNIAYKNWIENKEDLNLHNSYIRYRNSVTTLRRKLKKEHYNRKFENIQSDQKQTWKIINEIITNKNSKQTQDIEIISNNNVVSRKEAAEILNDFFTDVTDLLGKLPNTSKSTYYANDGNQRSIFLYPTTVEEVHDIITKMKPKHSSGEDGISPYILKKISPQIEQTITQIINQSIEEGKFPEGMKISKITPIHKKGNKTDKNNYRPIANITVFAKILEKVIHQQLMDFLEKSNFFYKRQYGFREKMSTKTAATDVITYIQQQLDAGNKTAAIFLDLTKAFDTVTHSKLLTGLENSGIRGHAYKWFESFLNGRSQFTEINGESSNRRIIRAGVPQGSTLSPALFLIFINDFGTIPLNGKLSLFADDATIIYGEKDQPTLNRNIEEDLKTIANYLNIKGLHLNAEKTHYMIFNKHTEIGEIKYMDTHIKETTKTSFLGLQINNRLDWTDHIENIKEKLSPVIGLLRYRLSNIQEKHRINVYYALIHSHLTYLPLIWGQQKTKVQELQRKQNMAIRAALQLKNRHSTEDLYKKTKILTIEEITSVDTLAHIHTIVTTQSKSNITLKRNKEKHNYNTRQADHIQSTHVRTHTMGKNTTITRGTKQYNKLPTSIKAETKLKVFKIKLKNHLLKAREA